MRNLPQICEYVKCVLSPTISPHLWFLNQPRLHCSTKTIRDQTKVKCIQAKIVKNKLGQKINTLFPLFWYTVMNNSQLLSKILIQHMWQELTNYNWNHCFRFYFSWKSAVSKQKHDRDIDVFVKHKSPTHPVPGRVVWVTGSRSHSGQWGEGRCHLRVLSPVNMHRKYTPKDRG